MRGLLLFWLVLLAALPVSAHEVRPAALDMAETEPGHFNIIWKQPITDGRRLNIAPVLPENCTEVADKVEMPVGFAWVTRWQVACDLRSGEIRIAGLERTLTDVFVTLRYIDGEVRQSLLRPGLTGLRLSEPASGPALGYIRLGFEHILSGPDHLLFVAGLLLIAPLRKLFWVITGFTLAHSLTLGLTALGVVSLHPPMVETLIALSILLLGVEATRRLAGTPSLIGARPWIVSFGFGLLHGFGFAGALSEIGLPQNSELAALLFFNLGVEAGQLAFLILLLVCVYALLRVTRVKVAALQKITAYGVGGFGAFWVLERMGAVFTL